LWNSWIKKGSLFNSAHFPFISNSIPKLLLNAYKWYVICFNIKIVFLMN
jgi:hypothetical protein